MLTLGLVAGVGAFAGQGGPIVAGSWTGYGQAIYMDGTMAQITIESAMLYQQGDFVYGNAQFSVAIGGDDPILLPPAQLSGHVQGNRIKGTFGACFGPAPNCFGAAVFEGKISGNKMTGTVIDLSDGGARRGGRGVDPYWHKGDVFFPEAF